MSNAALESKIQLRILMKNKLIKVFCNDIKINLSYHILYIYSKTVGIIIKFALSINLWIWMFIGKSIFKH